MTKLTVTFVFSVVLAATGLACKRAERAAASAPEQASASADVEDEAADVEPDVADETESEEADALYAKGVAAERAGKLEGAARWFEEACGAGLGAACGRLGEMYGEGRGVHADDRRAHDLFEQGCALGSTLACDAVGH